MLRFLKYSLMILLFFIVLSGNVYSRENFVYIVDPQASSINCSIRYTLIGKYEARFENFSGDIVLDWQRGIAERMTLQIETQSIKSKYPKLDKMVRSKRLLDAKNYPTLSFSSQPVILNKDGSQTLYVKGSFDLHGIQQELTLPFTINTELKSQQPPNRLEASGRWTINRKDFDIFWHPILDKGGVVVANHVVVDWNIVALRQNK